MSSDQPPQLRFSAMGESAVLCDAAGRDLDLVVQRRIWSLALFAETREGILEAVPGMNNLLVIFDPFRVEREALMSALNEAWPKVSDDPVAGRRFDIPVIYGGEAGEDLTCMARMAHLSVEQFVSLHAGGEYCVYALGSQPGFAYLGGLDPRLAMPRRDVPRPRVQAGTVMIGGAQTAVLSRTTPSGWHLIGRTDVEFFDPDRSQPALLAPGDRLRFLIEEIVP